MHAHDHSRLNLFIFFSCFFFHQAEARAEFAERSVQKLQKEVDRLEGIYACICVLLRIIFILESDPKKRDHSFSLKVS